MVDPGGVCLGHAEWLQRGRKPCDQCFWAQSAHQIRTQTSLRSCDQQHQKFRLPLSEGNMLIQATPNVPSVG